MNTFSYLRSWDCISPLTQSYSVAHCFPLQVVCVTTTVQCLSPDAFKCYQRSHAFSHHTRRKYTFWPWLASKPVLMSQIRLQVNTDKCKNIPLVSEHTLFCTMKLKHWGEVMIKHILEQMVSLCSWSILDVHDIGLNKLMFQVVLFVLFFTVGNSLGGTFNNAGAKKFVYVSEANVKSNG